MASTTFLQQAYLAYFGRPADVSGLSFYADKTEAQVVAAFSASPESQAFFGSLNTLAQINTIYQNLFNRPAEPAGLTYWSGEINAGRLSLAQASMGILNGAQNADKIAVSNKLAASTAFTAALDTTDEMIGYQGTAVITSARAFLASVSSDAATLTAATSTTALNATVAATVAAGSTASVAGQTFTLTTSAANNFAGDSLNNSFDASLSAGAQTWQASDVLSGGNGIDTINATLISSVTPTSMTGIEVVNVTVNTASTLNLANATGVTNVNSISGAAAQTTTLSGIATSVAVSVADTTASHTINYSNVTGSADAATIKVSGIATGTNTFTVAGIETLTLNAVTSASVIDTLTVANTTSLLASGDQALTITAGVSATVRNVDASAKTAGGLTMTMGAVADATIVGGAGNDVFTIDAVTGTVSANGGAGNDTFTAATNLTITDTINGGDGTDTLSSVFASVSTAGYTTPTTRTISNIETLLVTDAVTGALTAVGIDTGITTVTMGVNATNTAAAVTFNAGNSTLNIGSGTTTAAGITTSLAVAGSTGGTDSITIKNNNVSTMNAFSSGVPAAVNITATNTETLTLDTGTYTTAVAQVAGTVSVAGSTGFQTAETLNIRGGNVLTLGAVTADIIDASAMTATTGTTLTTVTGTTAQTVTGSGGNDVLVIDGTSNVSVNGGAGNDTITGGAGNDILLGGAGADSITSAAGNDSVDGGIGNDTVVMGTTFSVGDTLIGGDGVDILSIGQAATSTIAARASGFETLLLSAGATQDMALFTNNTGFTRVNANTAGGTFSFTNAGAGVVTLGAETATAAITFALASGTASDSLTIAAVDNATQTAITAADIETLTINNAATAASANAATITTLSAAALKTLNITGLGGTIITNAITNATGLTAVNDNHTGAGAVTLNLSTSTGAVTYTGGTATGATTLVMGNGNNIVTAGTATTVGNFTVTGGTGNDSITGGFGADNFSGGAGADTLIGGSGIDTLDGGAGNDSISGGDGDDQFTTDSGADTIDGGAGTDVLTISTSYTDLSLDTITLIETVNMQSTAATMTIAQHAAFTTVNNAAAITLSDAGSLTGKTNVVTVYNLANGTNTFTASTTAAANSVTGGSGADTFNFGLLTGATTHSMTTDSVHGGTGTDTLNITGNILFSETLTNVTGIENIVFGNTTTAVTATLVAGNGTNTTGSITLDASATSGIVTFSASTVDTVVGVNMIGGSGADILTGGTRADTISGGAGGDSITGGAGADVIVLADGATAAVDEVVVTTGITVDTITGFTVGTGGDSLDFSLGALNAANAVTNTETDTIAFFGAAGAVITDATAGATNAVAIISSDASNHATITGATVILLHGGATTFANVGAAVDAFEASGGFTITHQSNVADDDTFLFAYENSTTGFVHIAAASFEAADDNNAAAAVIADGALKGTDLVILSGVVNVELLTAANFDFIA